MISPKATNALGDSMDVTTLLTVASLFLGLIVSNAALFGDSLYATLSVPKSVEATGITQPVAEKMFAVSVASYSRVPSLLATPAIQTGSAPSLPMALAKPLNLQDVVYSVQAMVRDDAVNVAGAIVEDGKGPGLLMYMVVNNPPDTPITMVFSQPDGNASTLIETAARRATEIVAPFRVANTDFANAQNGNPTALARGKATAQAGLAQPWDPSMASATEIVLLRNLLALMAMMEGDKAEASQQFALGAIVPGAEPAAYGLMELNQAFFAVADRQHAEVDRLFRNGSAKLRSVQAVGLQGRVMVLHGLVLWSNGQAADAERMLRGAIEKAFDDQEAHAYLAALLTTQGRTAEAVQHKLMTESPHGADKRFPSLAHIFLRVDPIKGGFTRNF